MTRHSTTWMRCSWALALAMLTYWPVVGVTARDARTPTAEDLQTPTTNTAAWDTFTADVSMRQTYLRADGSPLYSQPPVVALHVERRLANARWHTALTVRAIDRPTVRSRTGVIQRLDHPFLVTRMEYDDDGTAPRLYNDRGQIVRMPGAADRTLFASPTPVAPWPMDWDAVASRMSANVLASTGTDWVDGIVATPERRGERRAAIEQRFGAPIVRVAGLDRYAASAGSVVQEMFVQSEAVVPVEASAVRSGALVARTTYGHEPRGGGVLVRRLTHGDWPLAEVAGMRIVADVEITNVVAAGGVQ